MGVGERAVWVWVAIARGWNGDGGRVGWESCVGVDVCVCMDGECV